MRHISRAGHAKRGRKKSKIPEKDRFFFKQNGKIVEYSSYDALMEAVKRSKKKVKKNHKKRRTR